MADLEDFAFKDLSYDARGADFAIRPHITKIVKMGLEGQQSGIHFPLKERYRECNLTVKGREDSYSYTCYKSHEWKTSHPLKYQKSSDCARHSGIAVVEPQ